MSSQRISNIAAVCLFLIFVTQAFLVNDYFHTTRAGLIRESNAILEDAFRKELNLRHKKYRNLTGEDTITTPSQAPTMGNIKKFDGSKLIDYSGNILGVIDLAINSTISEIVPLNLHNLDSITETLLKSRKISSKFVIKKINAASIIVEQSKNEFQSSLLQIPSNPLSIDFARKESLQLVLINPFGFIIKRMSLMLISSLVLSIICLLAFRFLDRILARQKQLVAFKNEFLGTIAHELKRPVASLSFNLDCLAMPTFMDNRQKHELLVTKSINATSELNDTINMIIALAKLEEGLLILNKELVNLKKLFEDLKNKFVSYPVKKVEIQTIYEANELLVSGDKNLLNQCFANLIDNAIKYSDTEVLIVITIYKTGHWIVTSIKDNGYGIPQEKLPVIFDKYTRVNPDDTKINGFGIGLNYVKTIIEKHKGEVDVNSQHGEGSEFNVLLPN